jgi:hypothetical protein
MLQIVDRGCRDYIPCAVLRSSVRVYDDHALPGEILEESNSNGLYNFSDGRGIVMRRHTDKQVHFANADQFANEIVAKNACLFQMKPLSRVGSDD